MEKFERRKKPKMKEKYKIIVKPEFKNIYVFDEYICGEVEYDDENNVIIIDEYQVVGKYSLDHVDVEKFKKKAHK